MNRHQEAVARLTTRQTGSSGVPVTLVFCIGDVVVEIETTAIAGRVIVQTDYLGNSSGRITESDRDFVIASSVLVYAGEVVEPPRGLVVREAVGGATHVYELLPQGGEPGWRHTDQTRSAIRIHTKRVQ